MYVMRGEREVKLIVSEGGEASIFEGKTRSQITPTEAEALLIGRLTVLRQKALCDLTYKADDSCHLESIFRYYLDRTADCNNCLRLLDNPKTGEPPTEKPAIEVEVEFVTKKQSLVTDEKKEKPGKQKKVVAPAIDMSKRVILRRKKVLSEDLESFEDLPGYSIPKFA